MGHYGSWYFLTTIIFFVRGNLKIGFDNRFMQVLNFDRLQGTFTLIII